MYVSVLLNVSVYLILLFVTGQGGVDPWPWWAVLLLGMYLTLYFYWCALMVSDELVAFWKVITCQKKDEQTRSSDRIGPTKGGCRRQPPPCGAAARPAR